MNRFQRIRKQAMSLRGGIAVAGALAVAVSLTQVAGTMAAPDLEPRTAKVPIATANYYPTPLPDTNISCRNSGTLNLKATFSWEAPSLPGNYRYRVTVWDGDEVKAGPWVQDNRERPLNWNYEDRGTYHIAVQVINYENGVDNATSSGELRRALWHDGLNRVNCTGDPWRVANQPWENSQSWSPGAETLGIGQPLVNALRGGAVEADGAEEKLLADATLDEAGEASPRVEASEGRSVEPSSAVTSTSPSASRTSSSPAPTPAPAERSTTSSSSTSAPSSPSATSPSPSTSRATSSTTATSTAPATTRATTTSTTVPATSTSTSEATTVTPVALPGGGEAKLVGEATLVISDDEGQVCSATVREGSTLKVRSGVLEVTDARGTREVDPQTCELT